MGYPKTSDGKQIVLLSAFPGTVNVAHPGAGDSTGRWDGTLFTYECSEVASGDYVAQVWGFNEWVYMAGGALRHAHAVLGDALTYDIHAPASVTGAGAAYDKVATGLGFSIIVPGTSYGLDLANDAVPVPNDAGTGWFDWDPGTGAITVNLGQTGGYDLYDAELTLVRFLPRLPVWGGTVASPVLEEFSNPVVKPKRLLPQWKHRITFHNSSDKSTTPFKMSWRLFVGRLQTK